MADGQFIERLKGDIKPWGMYQRYNYVKFDFSSVKAPCSYFLQYGDRKTNTFSIGQDVYIGHPVRGIIVPNLHQYHHLGDAVDETDNLPYNRNLKPYESDGKSSGTMDDRWVFTNRNPSLDYQMIATLVMASRALKGYNGTLSQQSLHYAKQLWNEDETMRKNSTDTSRLGKMFSLASNMTAALQLYITTNDESYAKIYKDALWPMLDRSVATGMTQALQANPYLDKDYQDKLKPYVLKFKILSDGYDKENPYGVPMAARGWGANGTIINWSTTNYYANKYFPDMISTEYFYKGLNYIFGTHPCSNISFVSDVGVKSKKVTYGNNRANFSFIAGGVVQGLLMLKPDFPENKEDWPFFWGENEVVIGIFAQYIFLASAADSMAVK
jgi:endoglucanase